MTVKVFCGAEVSEHENEWIQFKEVYSLIRDKYENKKESVYILANVATAGSQIDTAVLMKKGIIIIDLKSYKGEIKGSENGDWEVITDSGKTVTLHTDNLFKQLQRQKFDLYDKLKLIRKGNFERIPEDKLRLIQAWGYFENGSSFDREQIGRAAWPWFDVVWKDTFLEKLEHFKKPGYILEEKDMQAIRKGLNLKEYNVFDKERDRSTEVVEKGTDKVGKVHQNNFISDRKSVYKRERAIKRLARFFSGWVADRAMRRMYSDYFDPKTISTHSKEEEITHLLTIFKDDSVKFKKFLQDLIDNHETSLSRAERTAEHSGIYSYEIKLLNQILDTLGYNLDPDDHEVMEKDIQPKMRINELYTDVDSFWRLFNQMKEVEERVMSLYMKKKKHDSREYDSDILETWKEHNEIVRKIEKLRK